MNLHIIPSTLLSLHLCEQLSQISSQRNAEATILKRNINPNGYSLFKLDNLNILITIIYTKQLLLVTSTFTACALESYKHNYCDKARSAYYTQQIIEKTITTVSPYLLLLNQAEERALFLFFFSLKASTYLSQEPSTLQKVFKNKRLQLFSKITASSMSLFYLYCSIEKLPHLMKGDRSVIEPLLVNFVKSRIA